MQGQRNTEQKKIILNELACADHPTASQLYEIVRQNHPNISRATVFRVLSQFAESGKIKKIELLGSDTRFDARCYPHAHMHCVGCGKIIDVLTDEFDQVLNLKDFKGFKIHTCEIEFSGLCAECDEEKILN